MSAVDRPSSLEEGTRQAEREALSPTGRVILGMVGLGKSTGYEIKQLVDRSTRFFWAASYGQIYPELRRLEQAGLLSSHEEPTGGRLRTVYALTETGRQALEEWLASDMNLVDELRNEGMLKLFFSDLAGPERRLQIIRQMRESCERKHAQLSGLSDHAGAEHGPGLTLSYGLAMTAWTIEWCRETEHRLSARGAA